MNPKAVRTSAGETILFASSYQREVYAQRVGSTVGPLTFLGGRRGAGFFAAAMAGAPTVFMNSPVVDPQTPLPEPGAGNLLIERSFDGMTLGDWRLVTSDVSMVPAIASRPDDSATILIADVNGQLLSADGVAGAWGPFNRLPVHDPLDVKSPFAMIHACY